MSDWPFAVDPDAPPGAYAVGPGWSVFDASGKYLSSITTQPESGELIALTSEPRPLRVVGMYPELMRVVVERT